MKKLNIAIALALGLLLPFSALAAPGNDITIRLMQMNEKSTQEVMNRLELPDMAIDKVTEDNALKSRAIKRVSDTQGKAKNYAGEEPGDSNFSGEGNDQYGAIMDREMEQDRVTEMEQEHNELENELEEPRQGNEPPVDPQPGSGSGN